MNKKILLGIILLIGLITLSNVYAFTGNVSQSSVQLTFNGDYNNTGTATGTTFTNFGSGQAFNSTVKKLGTYALTLNGSGNIRSGTTPSGITTGNKNISASGWFYFTTIPTSGQQQILIYDGFVDVASQGYQIDYYNNGGLLQLRAFDGAINYNITFSANTWYHIAYSYSSNRTMTLYINGTLVSYGTRGSNLNMQYPTTGNTGRICVGSYCHSASNTFKGVTDDFRYYDGVTLTTENITQIYNGGTGTEDNPITTVVPPAVFINNVTFISQFPSDINSFTLFTYSNMNISYKYQNDSYSLSNLRLNYTLNGSLSCVQIINGSCTRANNVYTTKSFSYATPWVANYTNVTYMLMENEVYPYIELLNYTVFNQTHTAYTLGNNDFFSTEVYGFNVSENNYYFLEQMVNVTSGGLARAYICNSSYTSGNVDTSSYCQEIGSINATGFNHSHFGNSGHNVLPFNIISGKVNGGITATSTLKFLVTRVSGSVNVWYVNNSTRETTTSTSGNSGVTWTQRNYTSDLHVHVYPSANNLYLNYKGEGLFNGSLTISTNFTSDLINLIPLSPTAPVITNPLDTIQASRYLNITWLNATGSAAGVNITRYNISLLNSDLSSNRLISNNTYLNNSYYYDVYAQNLSLGVYYVQVCGIDTSSAFSCDQEYFNLTRNGVVNITATNYTGGYITSFILNSTNINTSELYYNNSNNGYIFQDIIINNTYAYLFDNSSFAYKYVNNTPTSYLTSLTTVLLPTNSVNITIRDEFTNALITQNVTVRFEKVGSAVSYTYYTTTGLLFPEGLQAGSYTVTFTSTSPVAYNVRFYNLDIIDRQSTTLDAFLNNGGVVLLNYKNQAGQPLPFVDVVVSRVINGSFTTVESLTTQIDGRTQFNYLPSTRYRIVSTLAGYDNLTFELNPVLFTSYDVTMTGTSTNIVQPTAFASWSPTSFVNNMNTQLTFQIISPYGSLRNYTVRLDKNGVPFYLTYGSLPSGELIYIPFNTTNSNAGDYLTVYYYYLLSNGANQSFTFNYPIIVPLTNRTLTNMGTDFFGLGVGDRVLIVVFLNILAFGVGFLVAGTGLGTILMMGNSLIFMTSGFVPSPVFYISIVIGVLILMGRGINDG